MRRLVHEHRTRCSVDNRHGDATQCDASKSRRPVRRHRDHRCLLLIGEGADGTGSARVVEHVVLHRAVNLTLEPVRDLPCIRAIGTNINLKFSTDSLVWIADIDHHGSRGSVIAHCAAKGRISSAALDPSVHTTMTPSGAKLSVCACGPTNSTGPNVS